MADEKEESDLLSSSAIEAFLDRAADVLDGDVTVSSQKPFAGEPKHRQLQVVVTGDGIEASLEAIFPDTTYEEVLEVLKQERIVWGIQECLIKEALERADRSGRRQRNVLIAKGKRAVYIKRRTVSYPFLDPLKDPETGHPIHLASSVFREIADIFARTHIDRIRGYAHPVVAVPAHMTLMQVQGEDEIEPGMNVFGKIVRELPEDEIVALKKGDGVTEHQDGTFTASRFGYVSIVNRTLFVISPIWISEDQMEAYFINPPQLSQWHVPQEQDVVKELMALGICIGIDKDVIRQMCRDLKKENLRESCVRVARGERPNLSKGQIAFTFEPLPPARYEAVQTVLNTRNLEDFSAFETAVTAVHAGDVLAEQSEESDKQGPGRNLFGEMVAAPEGEQEKKVYKAGVNVRRESQEGRVRYISEIYGYVGIVQDHITVLSPIWLSPDRMTAYWVMLSQPERLLFPKLDEVEALLTKEQVRFGVDPEAVAQICQSDLSDQELPLVIQVAQGTPPEPGQGGVVEALFERMPEPGALLDDGAIDFRERNAVPNVESGQLLARRLFPTPGKSGITVRNREIQPPKSERELLYAGPNVVSKEGEDGAQEFYATQAGFARIVKDTLSVMQRFRYQGDVDYKLGNVQFDGDVEIGGKVKSRFRIEASGDVYIDGLVEHHALIIAKGDVVVRGGIIGGKVHAGGSVYAKFVQEAEIESGQDVVVRNYVRDSQIRAQRKATIQGDEGGQKQLCVIGGVLQAGLGVEASSVGTMHGRQTRVVAGVDREVENLLNRYRKGLAFCEKRNRQATRSIMAITGGSSHVRALEKALKEVSEGQRKFLVGILKELQELDKLGISLRHYVKEFEAKQTEMENRAQIRITGTAFPRVTVQIGEVYRVLKEEVQRAVFQLDETSRQITQTLL